MRIFGFMWVQNWAQLQGVPKVEGDVSRLDFWTTLGHPGYLEPGYPEFGSFGVNLGHLGHLGPKILSFNITLKTLFATSFWDNRYQVFLFFNPPCRKSADPGMKLGRNNQQFV